MIFTNNDIIDNDDNEKYNVIKYQVNFVTSDF